MLMISKPCFVHMNECLNWYIRLVYKNCFWSPPSSTRAQHALYNTWLYWEPA